MKRSYLLKHAEYHTEIFEQKKGYKRDIILNAEIIFLNAGLNDKKFS
jgi:hypothetical protein